MKIVHIAFYPYNDYWGYQENLLPKYHKKLGNDVTVITTNLQNSKNGIETLKEKTYHLNDGTKIIRIKQPFGNNKLVSKFGYYRVYDLLLEENPDMIMFHGLGSITISQAIKYKKNSKKECKIILDNHQDDGNSRLNKSIAGKILTTFFRIYQKNNEKYYHKIYGVTPWRVEFARHTYGISEKNLALLPMGADDEYIDFDNKGQIRKHIRKELNISENSLIFITGGKLDKAKKILEIIKSFDKINNKDSELIIFGSISSDIENEVFDYIEKNKNIKYIGFLEAHKIYNYFFAADIALFPGTHSVLWEQAVASGIPCIFSTYTRNYLNFNDNAILLKENNEENIYNAMQQINDNKILLAKLKENAMQEGKSQYWYSEIAKKSLE